MDDFPKLDECLLAWLGAGRWRVLGCELRPMTLMHRELLRMLGSGLVTGKPVLLPELDLAVQICRRTPAQAAKWMRRRQWRWLAQLRMCWLMACYGWRMKRQWQVLKEYLESCENTPDLFLQVQDQALAPAQRRDAPALLDMWSTLTAAGFNAEDLLQRWPAGLVRWLHETIRSKDGGRKFETEADRQLAEKARKMKEITEPKLCPTEQAQARIVRMMRRMRR